MPRSKATLPTDTKLDYSLIEGVPTISIAARLTTRAQVNELIGQLEKLEDVLPETIVRKAKSKNGRRATSQTDKPHEETT